MLRKSEVTREAEFFLPGKKQFSGRDVAFKTNKTVEASRGEKESKKKEGRVVEN